MENILMGDSSPDNSDTENNNSERLVAAAQEKTETASTTSTDNNLKKKSIFSEEPAKKKAKIQPSCQIIHEAVTQSDIIIVSVGSNENMQKFQCSRTILSFTNSYFKGMLKSGMEESINNEIKFPDDNPEGWKIFCEGFASPDILSKIEHNHRSKSTRILRKN